MKITSLVWIGISIVSIIQFFIEKELIYAAQSLVCSGVATVIIWLANIKEEQRMNKLRQEVILAKLDVIIANKEHHSIGAISNNIPQFFAQLNKPKTADCGKQIKIR